MEKVDHPHDNDSSLNVPRCIENNLLRIEKGPWGVHARAKRRIAEGTVITRNASLSYKYDYNIEYFDEQEHHSDANKNTTTAATVGGDSCCAFCSTTPTSLSETTQKAYRDIDPIRMFRCSACHVVKYCGRDCQRLDFSQHKRECQYLQTTLHPKMNHSTDNERDKKSQNDPGDIEQV